MFNKKIITALGLTFSGMSFAGTMGPVCSPASLTVPCVTQQWDIGVQALYLKPAYHFLHERQDFITPNQFAPIDSAYAPLDINGDKWHMAYALEGAYHFSTGNDIRMQWLHFDANQTHEHLNNFAQKTRFNQANLELGQHINFTAIKNARLYSGLQYADLHITSMSSLALPSDSTPLIGRHQNFADYNGIGPMMGVDFAYMIGSSGFSLTANTTTSLLYGTGRSNANASVNGLVVDHPYMARKMMVPGLEEKLGINYDTQFSQGLLSINGGYQALNYFNVITRAQSPKVAMSDFGMYGPYLGVRWLGAA